MPTVTTYLPNEVFLVWKKDKSRRGLITKLVAKHYGFTVNKSRVVVNTSTIKKTGPMPHLAGPLIERYKADGGDGAASLESSEDGA